MNSRTIQLVLFIFLATGGSGQAAQPTTRAVSPVPEAGPPRSFFGQPIPSPAEEARHFALEMWADRNFFTTVDLFLNAEDLKAVKPTMPGVVNRGSYEVGDILFLRFQPAQEPSHLHWVNVATIVAARFSMDPAKLPPAAGNAKGDAERLKHVLAAEGGPKNDAEMARADKTTFDLMSLILNAADFYFRSDDVRNEPTLTVGAPLAHETIGGLLFVRFRSSTDDNERWLLNMQRVVAISPRASK